MAIIHLRETLLLVNFLLFRFIHGLRVAGVVTLQLALSETNLHAVVHRNGAAVHGALHLAGLLHLDNLSGSLDEVSPLDVGHAVAVGLDGGEVHGLLYDLALLPRHGLAFLFASPNLVSMLINIPVSDTVVLGDGVALWHLLVVLHGVLLLLAVPVREVLVSHVALLSFGRPDLRSALRPTDSVAFNFRGIFTDPLALGYTVFFEDGITALGCCGGVLDHIPEGDISAEVFLQSCFTKISHRKETKDNGEKIEGRHDSTIAVPA